ncbi:MAG: hypothetical protein IKX43_12255 [Paludibacteraceae bacterium]|jgi:hypothetical protein|nr:hypothetical protein [Paludibacteraceae bacterium]
MRNVLKALLIVASVLLAYMCYRSVMNPIEFEEQKAVRDKAVIEKLINIRKAQIAYNEANMKYADKMSDLINFINTGVIPKVAKKGELTDEQLKAGLTEEIAINLTAEDAAKYGITNYDSFMTNFRRDTNYVNVKSSIFGEGFNTDTFDVVPFTNKQAKFDLKSTMFLTKSNVEVPLFEASVPYDVYLNGLNKQEIINLNEKAKTLGKFAGLKVGDISSPNNNSGNWE